MPASLPGSLEADPGGGLLVGRVHMERVNPTKPPDIWSLHVLLRVNFTKAVSTLDSSKMLVPSTLCATQNPTRRPVTLKITSAVWGHSTTQIKHKIATENRGTMESLLVPTVPESPGGKMLSLKLF